jgi:hypothetical protein
MDKVRLEHMKLFPEQVHNNQVLWEESDWEESDEEDIE